jgi:hypothetical protein
MTTKYRVTLAYDAYNVYTVEASSEEEAEELVLSGEADVEDKHEENFEVVDTKQISNQ